MQVEKIDVNRKVARELYQKYKAHRNYSEPIDWEIQRAYQLLAQGKLIIRAIESIKTAGLDSKGLPKLAISPATAKVCFLRRYRLEGSMVMTPRENMWRRSPKDLHFGNASFDFPLDSFGTYVAEGKRYYRNQDDHCAQVPIVPIHLRPKRGLESYSILWEAEWTKVPARDPYLLRRIGKADLWLVVAMWDLTEVERAALSTRITVN